MQGKEPREDGKRAALNGRDQSGHQFAAPFKGGFSGSQRRRRLTGWLARSGHVTDIALYASQSGGSRCVLMPSSAHRQSKTGDERISIHYLSSDLCRLTSTSV